MNHIKLAIFDLDSTLSLIGHGIPLTAVDKLKQLSARGVQLAICSGKSTPYLCGMMRQIELHDVILMGEIGLSTQVGYELPPSEFYSLPIDPVAAATLDDLRRDIKAAFPGIWMQSNEMVVTPFFATRELHDRLEAFLDSWITPDMPVDRYEYQDCFDICPRGLDKGVAVRSLLERMNLRPEEVAAVGDGANDIPMFRQAGLSILVGGKTGIAADVKLPDVDAALDHLLRLIH